MTEPNPTSAVNPGPESLAALARLPDDTPIVMLNLLKFAGEEGRASYARYARVSGAEIAQRGGRVLYVGDAIGNPDWDRVAVVYYPRRAAFLDMQKSPAYQAAIPDRTTGLTARLLFAFKLPGDREAPPLAEPVISSPDEIFVMNLLQYKSEKGKQEYQKYGAVAGGLINKLGGEVIYYMQAEQAMVTDDHWDNFVLVRYPSLAALQQMVATDTWQAANRNHRESGLAKTVTFPTRPLRRA